MDIGHSTGILHHLPCPLLVSALCCTHEHTGCQWLLHALSARVRVHVSTTPLRAHNGGSTNSQYRGGKSLRQAVLLVVKRTVVKYAAPWKPLSLLSVLPTPVLVQDSLEYDKQCTGRGFLRYRESPLQGRECGALRHVTISALMWQSRDNRSFGTWRSRDG